MPATSSPRLATPRQRSFIASLVRERGGVESLRDPLATSVVLAANGTLTARDASSAIERLLSMPRAATAPARRQDGEQIAPPSTGTRAGRMLLAGGIEATATLADGRHVTVSIRTRKRSGRGWTNAALGEADSRTNVSILGAKVGWLNVDADGRLLLTLRTRREDAVAAVRAIFEYAAGERLPYGVDRVQEASRCGRCFRTLTDPVSIDRGIGPECFGRDTSSQHIAAVRVENGSAVVPERMPRPSLVEQARAVEAGGVVEDFEVDEAETRVATTADAGIAGDRARQLAALEMAAEALTIPQATTRRVDSSATDVARARDLIAEALDGYFGEPESSFALGIFDQLAGR